MDADRLIPIGRFARLTDLSPRLLRKLDERGLLSPAHVDPETRYRYYDVSQTRTAGIIHLARQLDLPPDETRELLASLERGTLRDHLERHRERIVGRLSEQSRLLKLVDQELSHGEQPLSYAIAVKDVPALLAVCARGRSARTHPHDAWALERALRRVGAEAAAHIVAQGEVPDDHPLVLYFSDLARDDAMEFEVCFPVARALPAGAGVSCRELPAERVAFTTFRGAYETIWNAYVELGLWVAENGFVATGPTREWGTVTDADTDDPRQWVTEIAVPVAPR